jgi:hypothetical protein
MVSNILLIPILILLNILLIILITYAEYKPKQDIIYIKRKICISCGKLSAINKIRCINCNYVNFPINILVTSKMFIIESIILYSNQEDIVKILILSIIAWSLEIINDIDKRFYLISDKILIILMCVLLYYSIILFISKNTLYKEIHISIIFPYLKQIAKNVLCMAITLALILITSHLIHSLNSSIGIGDIKLMLILSIAINYEMLPIFLLLTGIIGIIQAFFWRIVYQKYYYPMAPSINNSFLILLLFGNIITLKIDQLIITYFM